VANDVDGLQKQDANPASRSRPLVHRILLVVSIDTRNAPGTGRHAEVARKARTGGQIKNTHPQNR